MNKIKLINHVIGLVILLTQNLPLMAQESPTLTFILSDFKTAEGMAVVNLFRETDDLPKKPFMTLTGTILNGSAEIVFINLPNGNYAAIAYHDGNSNGTLDHKLGFPNEPMGFSNNWELGLFSGMPTFKKLKFEHHSTTTIVEIKID